MEKPTFRQQYDKIVNAYLQNKLNPLSSCACFIGNLLNGATLWSSGRSWSSGGDGKFPNFGEPYIIPDMGISNPPSECVFRESNGLYSLEEVVTLEKIFLLSLGKHYEDVTQSMSDENRLFQAMEVTLEALKKLHELKGEIVEEYTFKKRELENFNIPSNF